MGRSSSKKPMLALCITPPSFRTHSFIAATKFIYPPLNATQERMPRLKSHSGSGGLLSHGSSSRRSLALKLLVLGMGGCALLAAVYLPGRETEKASESAREGNMRALIGVSTVVTGGCVAGKGKG